MNVLAYHPATFKKPKKVQEFSLLTANQASSLIEHEPTPTIDNYFSSSPRRKYDDGENFDLDYEGDLHATDNRMNNTRKSQLFQGENDSQRVKSNFPTVREQARSSNRFSKDTFRHDSK